MIEQYRTLGQNCILTIDGAITYLAYVKQFEAHISDECLIEMCYLSTREYICRIFISLVIIICH